MMSHPIDPFLRDEYRLGEIDDLIRHLIAAGTFDFTDLGNGLYSAAIPASKELEYTGYGNVWVRDNVHIAHMFHALGESHRAVRTVRSLTAFLHSQRPKMLRIIQGEADKRDPNQRPHVRFDGRTISELPVSWAHAQNDALGYWLWLSCKLAATKDWMPTAEDVSLFTDVVRYFKAIEFWQDEDNGHWEEAPKIEASSIGTVVAGLREFRNLGVDLVTTDQLLSRGRETLSAILPAECIQTDARKRREHDAALLFLIAPLDVVDSAMGDRIVENVVRNLLGPHGIRRYIGDSYWCQDYKIRVAQEARTADVSQDMSGRDGLLATGFEAQWCLFDPIVSIIHGRRFRETGDPERRRRQIEHLNRSLRQLTDGSDPFAALRCPESYSCEAGRFVPNDITPLLWTQANLRLSLQEARLTHSEIANQPGRRDAVCQTFA